MGVDEVCLPIKESVIVVMDANRNKGSGDALDWALKHIARRNDNVIVLGVLCKFGKKTSCFPLNMGISISGIWREIEGQGQEVRTRQLREEIERKKKEYQNDLKLFYQQCKKKEVTLEVKLAFGFGTEKITVEQARNSNPRWIVLDSHFKKHEMFIHGLVGCNVAVVKGKVASLTQERVSSPENPPGNSKRIVQNAQHDKSQNSLVVHQVGKSSAQPMPPQTRSPFWRPLSQRNGFPRAFSQTELEVMTNRFAEANIVLVVDNVKFYEGILQETPVLIKSFSENDERFWTMLKILSRVRHRNIMSLVGYCCTGTSMFLLCDYPQMGTLDINLQHDESAKNLSWKARWYIALEIGGSLRYLHEECVDGGAIVHLSICSSHVVLSYGCSAVLCNFITARVLQDDITRNDDCQAQCRNSSVDEYVSTDIRDHGGFLIELISGRSSNKHVEEQTFIDWALQLLENGPMSQLLDSRLKDSSDAMVVNHMATAALLCLRNNSGHRPSMSEVLAVVRGDPACNAVMNPFDSETCLHLEEHLDRP